MNNAISMTSDLERQKNLQALGYTALITAALLLLVIFIKWSIPHDVKITEPEAVEIVMPDDPNLGTSDIGSGTDQPQLPGDPAPAEQTAYTPPQTTSSPEESVKDAADDNETDPQAAPVVKPAVSRPDAQKINTETKTVKVNNPTPQPVVVAPPKPKATMRGLRGGTGNGGNGADDFKPGTGEGVAGGRGDQGVVGGNPNGTNYTGTPRNLGVRVVPIPSQTFQDDFNESGKIALDIVVDGNGKLLSAAYQINGSTLPRSSKQYEIALRRARELTYPKYEGGFKQKLTMNFTVN